MSAIEWRTQDGRSGETGYLGRVPVWGLDYNGIRNRNDPDHYVLRCALPGMKPRVGVETMDAGKERAGVQLRSWLDRAGLVRERTTT